MQFTLYNEITANASYQSNEDGSLTATNVIAQVNIVGAPAKKFIQTDIMPPFIIPKTTTAQQMPDYIKAQAVLYVQTTYPNT